METFLTRRRNLHILWRIILLISSIRCVVADFINLSPASSALACEVNEKNREWLYRYFPTFCSLSQQLSFSCLRQNLRASIKELHAGHAPSEEHSTSRIYVNPLGTVITAPQTLNPQNAPRGAKSPARGSTEAARCRRRDWWFQLDVDGASTLFTATRFHITV